MRKITTEKILKETENGYNLISDKFSKTRKHFWYGLEFVKNCVKNGDKILDFGCGNGRLLELFKDKNVEYLGLDISENLINKAKEKYQGDKYVFQKISSSESLPFPNEYFNTIYSIAVFHHLPSKNLRFKMTKELFRVLKPEGKIIITVWNLWQKKYIKHIFFNWKKKILGKSDLDWNDCYISFSDNDKENKFQRFHHAFTKKELKKLFYKAGFKIEKCEIINKRNILLIAKK